jgi:hypothetical protein
MLVPFKRGADQAFPRDQPLSYSVLRVNQCLSDTHRSLSSGGRTLLIRRGRGAMSPSITMHAFSATNNRSDCGIVSLTVHRQASAQ